MKKCLAMFPVGALLVASAAFAQPPAPGPVGIATGLQRAYAQMKTNLTQAADKMSEADYAFKPVPEIRSFGGQLAHVAQFHYLFCAGAKGVANPNQENIEQTKTTKADVVKALADSFAFCDDAFSSLTDATAVETVTQGRGGPTARAVLLTNLIAHDNEEYGIITVYMRLKSLVPPSTENAGRGRGGRGGRGQ
jgi:uncharacterized damage-inducible protein DinB